MAGRGDRPQARAPADTSARRPARSGREILVALKRPAGRHIRPRGRRDAEGASRQSRTRPGAGGTRQRLAPDAVFAGPAWPCPRSHGDTIARPERRCPRSHADMIA